MDALGIRHIGTMGSTINAIGGTCVDDNFIAQSASFTRTVNDAETRSMVGAVDLLANNFYCEHIKPVARSRMQQKLEMKNVIGYFLLLASAALFFLGIYLVIAETIGQQSGRFFLPQETVVGQMLVGLSGVFGAVGSTLVSGFLDSWAYTRSLLKRIEEKENKKNIRNAAILMAFTIFYSYVTKGSSSHSVVPSKNVAAGIFGNMIFSISYMVFFGMYVLTKIHDKKGKK